MKKHAGFTLVEMMIVVAILGVLGAIAIPMYSSYVESSRTAEGKSNLQQLRVLQEQYFSDNGEYAAKGATLKYDTAATTISLPAATAPLPGFKPGAPSKLNYDYEITGAADGQTYLAKATRRGSAPAKFYTIDQDNNKLDENGNPW
jgi:prepilin-type N-terminal cleavage/methylation domain-containing protein